MGRGARGKETVTWQDSQKVEELNGLIAIAYRVCDWCKHIRHTKEYLDFGDGERRLQFCSAKCLNQYKMDIFYKETQANLPAGLCSTLHPPVENKAEGTGVQLLTPDSWNIPLADARRKAPSPASAAGQIQGPGPSASTTASPSDTANCSVTKIPTPVPKPIPISENPNIPPVSVQPPASIVPPIGVPPRSPPMVMTNRGPVPLPIFMEQQIMQQIRPPFIQSKQGSSKSSDSSPSCSGQSLNQAKVLQEHSKNEVVDLTVRPSSPANSKFGFPSVLQGPQDGVIDLTVGHRSRLHNVIHRALHAQVKVEREPNSVVNLAFGSSDKRNCSDCRDNCSPVDSKTLPCSDGAHCCPVSLASGTPGLEAGAAVCNVIVNGTKSTEGSKNPEPPQEPKKPQSPEELAVSELESVKENNCASNCHLEGEAGKKAGDEPLAGGDKQDPNLNNPADEDHAYALRMLPKTGCVIQPVPKPAEKTAIAPCIISTPMLSTGPEDLEPPLKRRCLRIRNQNNVAQSQMTQQLPASSGPMDLANGHLQPSHFDLPPHCILAFH
ncbi:hypothetical protein EK904_012064 [Melospiza melodia maxima]|nr:hypothetical protein EK904_012064 [Melospiza melodia maxima]